MKVQGISPGGVVEFCDGPYKSRGEVVTKINERVVKLVLQTSNGIKVEKASKCKLIALKSGNNYIGLDGEILESF